MRASAERASRARDRSAFERAKYVLLDTVLPPELHRRFLQPWLVLMAPVRVRARVDLTRTFSPTPTFTRAPTLTHPYLNPNPNPNPTTNPSPSPNPNQVPVARACGERGDARRSARLRATLAREAAAVG